tara:strand:- start:144 stop:305 length:162 start_codon:yes stop_codon:yes gene_type:complete
MKRIYTQSEPTSLPTGVAVSFDFEDNKSSVQVTSIKVKENPDFNKPLKKYYAN